MPDLGLQPKSTGNPEIDALLAERGRAVGEMRRLNDSIEDAKISAPVNVGAGHAGGIHPVIGVEQLQGGGRCSPRCTAQAITSWRRWPPWWPTTGAR